MSDNGQKSIASAKDVRARAIAWFEKRQFWDWSEADQLQFDAWVSQSLAHRTAYVRVDSAWNRADRVAALPLSPGAPPNRKKSKSMFVPKMRAILVGAAGIVTVIAVGVGAGLLLSTPHKQVFATSIGGHEVVTLSDGSQIELNTDTVLRAAITAGRREVWLDKGEAYFGIVHDPARPFVVVAGNDRVTDVGTKFVVRREPDHLQVAVVEGRVRLDASNGTAQQRSVSLIQGDVVVATAHAIPLVRKSASEMANELSWRRGVLVFENTRLADAAAEFNRYNVEQIIVADPAAARLMIGGKFSANDTAAFAELAQHVLGLRVARSGNAIVISR